jgi:hypothetical protein
MSILANTLRFSWAPGLNEVSGNVIKGVGNWLADENYQIYSAFRAKRFTLQVADTEQYLNALAGDINRTAVAAFQSIIEARKSPYFPKSTAWVVIKSYYAAFFAAHAMMRMFGISFTNLERPQTAALNRIAKLYSVWHEDVVPGNFVSSFSGASREIRWDRVDSSTGGVHEKFWTFFKTVLDDLSRKVLKSKSTLSVDSQQVSTKLTELSQNLCYDSCFKGTWLSVVRNRINYKHQYGAWYPFRGQAPSGALEERLTQNWDIDPMTINLTSHGDRDLRRFQETCSFIVGCCRVLSLDMAERCPTRNSFHNYGWLAVSRLARQTRWQD